MKKITRTIGKCMNSRKLNKFHDRGKKAIRQKHKNKNIDIESNKYYNVSHKPSDAE